MLVVPAAGDALLARAFEAMATGIQPALVAARCCAVLGRAAGATALVVGNEGSGLTSAVTLNASLCAHIPMPGRVESLNASAAMAVAMFEVVRQRRGHRGGVA